MLPKTPDPKTLPPEELPPGGKLPRPGSRTVVLLGLVLSVLLVAGGLVLARLPGSGAGPVPEGEAWQTGAAADQIPGGSVPLATAAAPNTLPPAPAPDPERPLEVPPGAAGQPEGSLPASRELPEPRTLLSLPLPEPDAAEGRLVDAFPQDLVPPVPASTVLSSSVASSGNTLQAGLRAAADPAAVLEFYDRHFAALGFQPGARNTAGGVTTLVFSYGSSSVTVSTLPETTPGADPEYFVFAVLRAGR
ncbi:MAG: hypothetical protein ABS910_11310 [Arthrobacter sp.]